MNQTILKLLRPMILIFIFLNAFFLVGKDWLAKKILTRMCLLSVT